jgi:ribokinase
LDGKEHDMKELKEQLIEKLKESIQKDFKVVAMPHFCIDNFLQLKGDYKSFNDGLEAIVKQGGGNIAIKQRLGRGGKAANFASSLSSLGIKTFLIARTNELGYKLLEYLFEGKNVDISHVKKDGELAFTTAMEFKGANVMLSDPGPLSQFGPGCLDDKDEELIREADFVCVSDWGLNEKGTALAKHVFGLVKDGKGRTYFDPGDPSPRGSREVEAISELVRDVLEEGLVDILSLNEDEVKRYGKKDDISEAISCLRRLSRVDLHTKDFVRSYYEDWDRKQLPTFDLEPKQLTGAGDAWDVGNVYGELMGFSDELRLMLANAVAAYYISDPQGRHPTREDLIEFLGKNSSNKNRRS